MSKKLFTQTKVNDEIMRNIKRTLFDQNKPTKTQVRQLDKESVCVCVICKCDFVEGEGSTRKSVGNPCIQGQQVKTQLYTRPFNSDLIGSQTNSLIPSQQLKQSFGDSIGEARFQTPYRSKVISEQICPNCLSRQSQNTQKRSQSIIESYEINNSCEYESSVQYNQRNNINTILEQLDEEDTFYNVGFNQFQQETKQGSAQKENMSCESERAIQPIKSLIHRSQSSDFKSTPNKNSQDISYEKKKISRNGRPPLPNHDDSYSSIQKVPGAKYISMLQKNSDDSYSHEFPIPTQAKYNSMLQKNSDDSYSHEFPIPTQAKYISKLQNNSDDSYSHEFPIPTQKLNRVASLNPLNVNHQNKSFDNQSSKFVTPPQSNRLPRIRSSGNTLQIVKDTQRKTSRFNLTQQVKRLGCGFIFKKYGRQDHFFPSKRLIQLTPDLKFLIFRDEDSVIKKLIALTDIVAIKLGRKTENFKRFSSDAVRNQKSFSLMLRERTLDLEGQSYEEFNFFVNVIDRIEKLVNQNFYKGIS